MDYDDERLVELGGELIALGMLLRRPWLDAIAWPDLAGTCWGMRDHATGRKAFLFQRGGVFAYRLDSVHSEGTWVQVGNAVRFRVHDYSTHVGVVIAGRLRGLAENDDEQEWSWAGLPVAPAVFAQDELPDYPTEPHDTPPIKRPNG